jgi:hypothetical protein
MLDTYMLFVAAQIVILAVHFPLDNITDLLKQLGRTNWRTVVTGCGGQNVFKVGTPLVQVLQEIAGDTMAEMATVPNPQQPERQDEVQNAEEEGDYREEDDLMARLAAVRS